MESIEQTRQLLYRTLETKAPKDELLRVSQLMDQAILDYMRKKKRVNKKHQK